MVWEEPASWFSRLPRQGVLESIRAGKLSWAEICMYCSFLTALGDGGHVTSSSRLFLLWLPHSDGLWPGIVSANKFILPGVGFCYGDRNLTRTHGTEHVGGLWREIIDAAIIIFPHTLTMCSEVSNSRSHFVNTVILRDGWSFLMYGWEDRLREAKLDVCSHTESKHRKTDLRAPWRNLAP